jgi:hypothetical protein
MPPSDTTKEFIGSSSDSETFVRIRWKAKACPCAENCSYSSWKKARAESYVSREDCLMRVRQHLRNSSNHYLTDEEFIEQCLEAVEIEEEMEDYEARKEYRMQVRKATAARNEGKGGNKSKKGKGKVEVDVIAKLSDIQEQMSKMNKKIEASATATAASAIQACPLEHSLAASHLTTTAS